METHLKDQPIYLDYETCGLHGVPVLLQYAIGDDDIKLIDIWYQTANEVIELFEMIANHPGGIVGFNLTFDYFHLYKFWTILQLLPDKDIFLEDCIDQIAELEPQGRDCDYVLKPQKVCDVMLHARKGPYQSTMDRSDVRVRRVPTDLAWQLAEELEIRIPLKDIYFARAKEKKVKRWEVYDIKHNNGEIDTEFKDLVLKFNPSSGLKALAIDALGIKEDKILLFTDIEPSRKMLPEEHGYAPYAKAVGTRHNWNGAWPEKIKYHIYHWANRELAREYAEDDITYTRGLYKHFGSPTLGDDDSELSCCIAVCRWRGYKVDLEGIRKLREKALTKDRIIEDNGRTFFIPTAPNQVRKYVAELMTPTEQLMHKIVDTTGKVVLQTIAKLTINCPNCDIKGCDKCKNSGELEHPAACRARQVLDSRGAEEEVELYDKILKAGRLHAGFKPIGTLSGRMSGDNDLNAQGIKKDKEVRKLFPLAFGQLPCLGGGDFDSFEVTLADAVYNDPQLRQDLLDGKVIHALFGTHVYPGMTYEQILATKGLGEEDKYTKAKSAVFAMFYGGEGYTLKTKLGVDQETADEAYKSFIRMYPKVGVARQKVMDMFCSMRQPGGIGSQVVWNEPQEYVESPLGFRRYFTLENMICKALFHLASNPPKHWHKIKIKVQRRDREQTIGGAVQSALYACAFQIQSGNTRAAGNHVIQSFGATITKRVQRKIWDLQPTGKHLWQVQPFQIHDEIQCPSVPEMSERVKEIVNQTVESFRDKVPLIGLDWKMNLNSWADK